RLEQALQLLQLDPLFSRVQAELKAGTTPGRSVLTLNLTEANPLEAGYLLDNRESPSVGSVRNNAIFSHQNLLGLGDRLSAEAGFTQGVNSYAVNYDIPLNARNGTLNLQYSRSRQTVIEEPFAPLDLNSNTQTISLGFRQPLTLTPTNEFALGLSADLRRSRTFIGDIPFSFTTGPENGRSQVTVLRFSQDWVERGQQRVLAARSQFSLGLDALGATVNDTGTDGRFFSWVGQFQWVQSLGNNVVSIARVATQLTGDSLLPLEQFSIGGIDTVRGYRQNQRVGDSGIVGNFEVRFPVVNKPDGIGLIQIVPFFDIGTIWNNSSEDTNSNTLLSTGLGLRWQVGSYFEARLDWGIPLKHISQPGDTLQDNGIFFSIRLNPF
ncbi:MAG TPA: ShlB/FhaC/HecB family hemolysin secretion/activation protein, partial [Candidatus Obscuribacterales bacterium]